MLKFEADLLYLINPLGWAHSVLDVEGAHVLPVLLEQGDEEVDSQDDVTLQLLFAHLDMAHTHSQTQHLQHEENQ